MRKISPFKKLLVATLGVSIGFSALYGTAPEAHAATAKSKKVIATGKKYLGVPYRFGAPTGSARSFDCSSFTQYIFKKTGVKLPRTSRSQAISGKKVKKGYLSMGDLVFFQTGGSGISHVGVYAGNGKMIHTSSSRGVTVSSMNTSYWKTKFVTARRVL